MLGAADKARDLIARYEPFWSKLSPTVWGLLRYRRSSISRDLERDWSFASLGVAKLGYTENF